MLTLVLLAVALLCLLFPPTRPYAVASIGIMAYLFPFVVYVLLVVAVVAAFFWWRRRVG